MLIDETTLNGVLMEILPREKKIFKGHRGSSTLGGYFGRRCISAVTSEVVSISHTHEVSRSCRSRLLRTGGGERQFIYNEFDDDGNMIISEETTVISE